MQCLFHRCLNLQLLHHIHFFQTERMVLWAFFEFAVRWYSGDFGAIWADLDLDIALDGLVGRIGRVGGVGILFVQ